jgi:ATP-binding cassette subfamily C protein
MLEVYDRVLPSQSIPTLLVLSIGAFVLFCAQGFFDFMRGRILIRVGNHLEERLNSRIFDFLARTPNVNTIGPDSTQAPKHLDAIKNFLSSGGPVAFIDLPWIPFFIIILFLFHWILGVASLIAGLAIVSLTLYAEIKTRDSVFQLGGNIAKKAQFMSLLRRNAEIVGSMGLRQSLVHVYGAQSEAVRLSQTFLSDLGGGMGALSRSLRLIMQSGILGLGALLVIWGQASAGIIIASSILFGRALAPVDQVIANWRSFTSAREAWIKLEELFHSYPVEPQRVNLPKPYQSLRVESLSFADLRNQHVILRDISFSLNPGDGLCVIGPIGAGKSTLLRLLVNIWLPTNGRVMLDNAALDQWPSDDLCNHIGFVPQDVELFTGSIAQNISRFHSQIDHDKVLDAARQAGIHELVLKMK